MKFIKYISLLFLMLCSPLFAQLTYTENIDVNKLIKEGKAEASIFPDSLSEKLGRAFDGEAFTDLGGAGLDSIQITLSFSENVFPVESKVHFMVLGGTYTLETASTESDFDGKTGSYAKTANKAYTAFVWDSINIANDGGLKKARLTFKNPARMIYLGEWAFEKLTTISKLVVVPYSPVMLVPNSTVKLKAEMLDEHNKQIPYSLSEELIWTSQTPAVAQFEEESNVLKAVSMGTGTVSVSNASGTLKGSASVNVTDDFKPERVEKPYIIKVAVVYQNAVIDGVRYNVRHGWSKPQDLVAEIVKDFLEVSDSLIQFQITQVYDDTVLFSYRTDDHNGNVRHKMSWKEIDTAPYPIPDWYKTSFDYKAFEQHYNFGAKRDSGIIDEVWVYGSPYTGMWESQLMGPTGFWWNSTPITDVNFKKLLSIMGLNFERGVAEGIHSFGHRMESAVWHAYGRWDHKAPDPNDWELFTQIDKDFPGEGHVGNIHFPVNGTSDYDYDNLKNVASRADNWLRYPYLFDFVDTVGRKTWGGWDYQRNYIKWWYERIPRYKGIKNGILNNWWAYFVDYDAAVAQAEEYEYTIGVNKQVGKVIPESFNLQQNYPNPFNPVTNISYSIAEAGLVKITIYNILGQEVEILLNTSLSAGKYQISWKPSSASSGVYICRVEFQSASAKSSVSKSMKMVYLK